MTQQERRQQQKLDVVEQLLMSTHLVDEETAQEIVMEEHYWITGELENGAHPEEIARALASEYDVGEDGTPEINDQEMHSTHPITGNYTPHQTL